MWLVITMYVLFLLLVERYADQSAQGALEFVKGPTTIDDPCYQLDPHTGENYRSSVFLISLLLKC